MSEWPYIVAAYTVTWLVIGSLAAYLMLRTRAAQRRLRATATER